MCALPLCWMSWQHHKRSGPSVQHKQAALATAENIVFLYKGKLALAGPPAAFKATKDPVVRQFFAGKVEGPMEFF